MKKVIFISALAIAAAVSCTKSDIVDTKFNEQISFENYVGRDAMTKAAVATAAPEFGLYGFYTGAGKWSEATTANLWDNAKVTNGTPESDRYWTNDKDNYTFIAYAPYADEETNTAIVPSIDEERGPIVTYTVDTNIPSQKDLLYGSRVDMQKQTPVKLTLKHALSRITVKTSESAKDFDYHVYGIKISGNFPKTNTLALNGGVWGTPAEGDYENGSYVIKKYEEIDGKPTNGVKVNTPKAATDNEEAIVANDFAGTDNYLMVIPTPEVEGAVTALTLEVVYTTTFDEKESTPMTKTLPISVDFDKGYAYSFDLVFAPNTDDVISFEVTVDSWVDADPVLTPGEKGNDNPENWNKETQQQ